MEFRERHHWMDAVRGVAVLLVLIWHAFSIPYPTMPAAIEWVGNFLSVYRIPLLLFLSGLLLDQSVAKGAARYVDGKFRRIAWPLVVWSAILLSVGWPGADPSNGWYWLGDGAHLWYLGVLLACYAVGFLTRWVHPVVFLAAGLVLMELVRTDLAYVNNTLWFGLYVFAGATLSRWLDRWLRLGPVLPSLCLTASLAWAAYSATVNGYVPVAHWRPFVLSCLGVLAVIWFAARLPRARALEWVGQRSITFYVAHVPFIFVTVALLGDALVRPATYAIVLAVASAGCFVLARYASRSTLFEFPRFLTFRSRARPELQPSAIP